MHIRVANLYLAREIYTRYMSRHLKFLPIINLVKSSSSNLIKKWNCLKIFQNTLSSKKKKNMSKK